LAWKEFDGERTRLGALVSSDGGETWRERELASTPGNSDHPKVLVHAGRFFVFWPVSGAPLAVHAIP
jgi:hypothetical protein